MRIVSAVTILIGAVTLFTVLSPYVLPIVQNRNLWAAVSLIAILLFTSGQMFNHIRKVPYVAGDGNGGISYFAGGFQNQFGLETQIVAAICKSNSFFRVYQLTPCSWFLTWDLYRCCPLIRNHCSCIEGSPYGRCQGTTIGCSDLGRRPVRDVQLPAERVQDQEWWLSFLPPTVLKATWPGSETLLQWNGSCGRRSASFSLPVAKKTKATMWETGLAFFFKKEKCRDPTSGFLTFLVAGDKLYSIYVYCKATSTLHGLRRSVSEAPFFLELDQLHI